MCDHSGFTQENYEITEMHFSVASSGFIGYKNSTRANHLPGENIYAP